MGGRENAFLRPNAVYFGNMEEAYALESIPPTKRGTPSPQHFGTLYISSQSNRATKFCLIKLGKRKVFTGSTTLYQDLGAVYLPSFCSTNANNNYLRFTHANEDNIGMTFAFSTFRIGSIYLLHPPKSVYVLCDVYLVVCPSVRGYYSKSC